MASAQKKPKVKTGDRNSERKNGKAWKKKPTETISKGGAAGYSRDRLLTMLRERGIINEYTGAHSIETALDILRTELRQDQAEKKEKRREAQRVAAAERARVIADAKRRSASRRENAGK